MQTLWPGLGLVPANMVLEEVCKEVSQRIVLSELPGVPTRIDLSSVTVSGYKLFTEDATIWYNLDTVPGPIPGDGEQLAELVIQQSEFLPGGILHPNFLVSLALPNDGANYALYLVSLSSGPTVEVTLL